MDGWVIDATFAVSLVVLGIVFIRCVIAVIKPPPKFKVGDKVIKKGLESWEKKTAIFFLINDVGNKAYLVRRYDVYANGSICAIGEAVSWNIFDLDRRYEIDPRGYFPPASKEPK